MKVFKGNTKVGVGKLHLTVIKRSHSSYQGFRLQLNKGGHFSFHVRWEESLQASVELVSKGSTPFKKLLGGHLKKLGAKSGPSQALAVSSPKGNRLSAGRPPSKNSVAGILAPLNMTNSRRWTKKNRRSLGQEICDSSRGRGTNRGQKGRSHLYQSQKYRNLVSLF